MKVGPESVRPAETVGGGIPPTSPQGWVSRKQQKKFLQRKTGYF